MTRLAEDKFEIYFAEKIWEMIPAIYRQNDEDPQNPGSGVLRALVKTLAEQAAILRRSQDSLWDDEFIELCNDWAVPYIADLLGTRLVSAKNKRGRRIDVAKTIYYRRRKGTLRVLEELISDITGWEGKIVENFKRLGRTRHGLDTFRSALAGEFTNTMPGGWADLRNQQGSELVYGPFDEYHHVVDVRKHNGIDGCYNIPRLAIHLYRLTSYEVVQSTPYSFNNNSGQMTFDPSGRNIPLFIRRNRPYDWDDWYSAREWELPLPLRCKLLALSLQSSPFQTDSNASIITDTNNQDSCSYVAYQESFLIDLTKIAARNLSFFSAIDPDDRIIIDPERGRLKVTGKKSAIAHLVTYHYGFSGKIGAGTYNRDEIKNSNITKVISKGGNITSDAIPNTGITQISDNSTYFVICNKPNIIDVTLQSASQKRPYIIVDSDVHDASWEFQSKRKIDAKLCIDGLWIGAKNDGHNLILKETFECVIIKNSTIDPGGHPNCTFIEEDDKFNTQIPSVHLIIEAEIETLVIDSCITGPIYIEGNATIEKLIIRDSIIQSTDGHTAIDISNGIVEMERSTVIGSVEVHRLYCSDSLILGTVNVVDTQNSCFRFSAAKEGSRIPKQYEPYLYPNENNFWFTSTRFGHPGYAQLRETAPVEITRGAENSSEMGAFCNLINPIKLDSLKVKIEEYMPFGLIPIYINQT